MTRPRLYLDNCCFNRPFDDQSQLTVRLETEAVLFIQDKIKAGDFELVWLATLDFENEKNPYGVRQDAADAFRVHAAFVVATTAEIMLIAKEMQQKGLHFADSLHLASAIHTKCDCFITVDKKILNKPIRGIALLNPIDFVQMIEKGKTDE